MKLLCTDLDRTLLPNGDEPECAMARPLLWQMLDTHGLSLAYVSGRDLDRVLDAIDEYDLRQPDFIVADVGSSLYVPDDSDWINSEDWQRTIAIDWDGMTGDDIKQHLRGIDGLREQEASRQSLLKTSYYFVLDADREALCEQVADRLESINVQAARVMSDDIENAVGLLDVLPRQANKSGAIRYMRSLLELAPAQVLFAGDSGNDVAALVSAVSAVAVANADAGTQEAISQESRLLGTEASTYQAVGGLKIAGDRSLNGNYASGIIEGLVHYQPAWQAYLLDDNWVAEALERYPLASPVAASKSA